MKSNLRDNRSDFEYTTAGEAYEKKLSHLEKSTDPSKPASLSTSSWALSEMRPSYSRSESPLMPLFHNRRLAVCSSPLRMMRLRGAVGS